MISEMYVLSLLEKVVHTYYLQLNVLLVIPADETKHCLTFLVSVTLLDKVLGVKYLANAWKKIILETKFLDAQCYQYFSRNFSHFFILPCLCIALVDMLFCEKCSADKICNNKPNSGTFLD